MIIFFADVAASSLPYDVRYLTPLITSIRNAIIPTNPIVPFAHPVRIVSVNQTFTPPSSCCISPGPGRVSGFGIMSLPAAIRLAVEWTEIVAFAVPAAAVAAAASCRAMSVVNVIVSSFLNIVLNVVLNIVSL